MGYTLSEIGVQFRLSLDWSQWAGTVGCWSPTAIAGNHDFSSPPPFCLPSSTQWPGGRCRHHGDGLWMMRVGMIGLFRRCHDLRCFWNFFYKSSFSLAMLPLVNLAFLAWLGEGHIWLYHNLGKQRKLVLILIRHDFWRMGRGWYLKKSWNIFK